MDAAAAAEAKRQFERWKANGLGQIFQDGRAAGSNAAAAAAVGGVGEDLAMLRVGQKMLDEGV
jgi:hypothetical protein